MEINLSSKKNKFLITSQSLLSFLFKKVIWRTLSHIATIIVLSRKIFKQISKVFLTGYMISGNQIYASKECFKHHSHIIWDASVAMNKRFSKFTCDNWFRSWVLTSFIFEKNLSTHAVLRGKINIRWSSFKQLGKIIAQALSFKHFEYNLCASKEVSEALKMSLVVLAIH